MRTALLILALTACGDNGLVVINTAPDALITNPTDGQELLRGAPLTLVGLASDAQTAGPDLAIQWSTDRGPLVGEATWEDGEATLAIDDLPPGPRTLTLTVADGEGEATSHSIDITVVDNAAPTLTFTEPAPDTELLFGEPVTISILVSDDHNEARDLALSWTGATGPATPNADGTATTVLTDLAVGAHTITVEVTDTIGVSTQDSLALFITDGDVDQDGFTSTAVGGTDCNDGDAAIFPGAPETCNDVDDDCDGTVDESNPAAPAWYLDGDDDGFGAGEAVRACDAPTDHVSSSTDCDDARPSVHPDATEVCNGRDDNCDGTVDTDATDRQTVYADTDQDGFGAGPALLVCTPTDTQSAVAGDCDDSRAATFPGATETCNGIDDDCVGGIDDNAVDRQTFYRDQDGDTWGTANTTQLACSAPDGFVARAGDCNDAPGGGEVHPGATEWCNGIDDDCNSLTDDSPADPDTFYADTDGDGAGDPASSVQACVLPDGYVDNAADCNDSNPSLSPFVDGDDDGVHACTDCNDDAPTIYQGAPELCDGLDNDCNGHVPSEETANPDGDDYVECLDCDNTNYLIYPGAPERCNAVDDDCDGVIDEDACDCPVYHSNDGTPYQFCEGSLNWGQAFDACGDDYELVSIETSNENAFIRSVLVDEDFPWQTPPTGQAADDAFWTGGSRDTGSSGQFCGNGASAWQWLSTADFSYTNWRAGEPNSATGCEGCIEIWLDSVDGEPRAEWNDEDCGRGRNWICEGRTTP